MGLMMLLDILNVYISDAHQDIPDGMPCLESVTLGDDIWDEHWLPLQTKVGRGEATPSAFTVSHLTRPPSPCPAREEVPQTVRVSRNRGVCPSQEEKWDCQSLAKASRDWGMWRCSYSSSVILPGVVLVPHM